MLLRSLALRTALRQARSYRPPLRNTTASYQYRALHATRPTAAGLTNILEDRDSPPPPVQVKRITGDGIELMDGLLLPSSCIFLNGRVFLWDGPDLKDGKWDGWSKDRLAIFEAVVPKPEILLLGTGTSAALPPPEIRQYLTSIGISLDVMDAVSGLNIAS
ncbi:hypothetical protein FS837_006633 [Tulasnella sp. UAMH 9824]|nr:hypothetical protein FS837_006633 [Tulasnella sp. UAMH 9824]